LIDEFITHFESIWDEEIKQNGHNPVISRAEFDHIYNIQSKAEIVFKLLKRRINAFPHVSTLFQQHALRPLEEFGDNFKFESNIPIPHTSDNENLIRTFVTYLDILQKGDRYQRLLS